GFRGGKGVATLFGVIIALFPGAFGLVLLLFAIIFAITRIVSLSSIIAAITFPVVVIFLFHVETPSLILFSMVIAVFIPVTHQKNIVRLFRGEESRMVLKKPEKPTG
ncbi:MAG TPA: glycerol-3-phosphate acyltransferase, partial [Bacteroidales bacterium]|nr:glycerol-3-phosphate acyltransferase [Bacteroidales bacterium]